MENEQRDAREPKREYKCELCPYNAKNRRNSLTKHMLYQHSNAPEFRCPICDVSKTYRVMHDHIKNQMKRDPAKRKHQKHRDATKESHQEVLAEIKRMYGPKK